MNYYFQTYKGTQTIKDVKNKTMQLRTVLLLSILCILPCCGFPCEYCNLYTKITCYFCYFTFYTKNTLHYIWLWRLLLWKNIIYRRNASRSGSWGQEIFYRVQNISYRLFDFFDILKQLSIVTICMSILKEQNRKILWWKFYTRTTRIASPNSTNYNYAFIESDLVFIIWFTFWKCHPSDMSLKIV